MHKSDRKITTLASHRCFWGFFLLLSFLIILFRAKCWMLPPTDDYNLSSRDPLDPPRQEGVKKILQAVNELPSVPCVKGTCKLTAAFVRALAFSRSRACFLLLPSSRAPSHSSIFSLYLPASCSGGSVAGAAPSGSLSARFMFRISRLMRTKEINWRFKPNETSVKLTGLINGNK